MFKKGLLAGLVLLSISFSALADPWPYGPNNTASTGGLPPSSTVIPAGGTYPVALSTLTAVDGVPIESLKAPTDSDYTNALLLGNTNQVCIHLGPQDYVVNSNVLFDGAITCIKGTKNKSRIVATSNIPTGSNGTWIRFTGTTILIDGVIFDEAGFGATNNVWLAKVDSTNGSAPYFAKTIKINDSKFLNGGGTIGFGLWVRGNGAPPTNPKTIEVAQNDFINDTFNSNSQGGLRIDNAYNVNIINPTCNWNGLNGIDVNFSVGTDTLLNQRVKISGGGCVGNTLSAVNLGNFQQGTWDSAPILGNGNPSVKYAIVEGMHNYLNGFYCIQGANTGILVTKNVCSDNAVGHGTISTGGGCIQVAGANTALIDNICDNNGYYAIDGGGMTDSLIASNILSNTGQCINFGASQRVSAKSNKCWGYTDVAFNIPLVDNSGTNSFPLVTRDVDLSDNWIDMSSMTAGHFALKVVDGVQGTTATGNKFYFNQAAYDAGMRAVNAALILTDSFTPDGNLVTSPIRNGATTQLMLTKWYDQLPSGASNWEFYPDVLTKARIASAATIGNLSPYSSFNNPAGGLYWCAQTANGTGYHQSTTTLGFTDTGGPTPLQVGVVTGGNTLTVSSNTGLVNGQSLYDVTTPAKVPAGTTITFSGTTVTTSQTVTSSNADTLRFGGGGATAQPYIWNGQILGAAMTAYGVAYAGTLGAVFTDSNGTPGTGATCTPIESVAIPRNAHVDVLVRAAVTLTNGASSFTTITTKTGANVSMIAGQTASCDETSAFLGVGAGGSWYCGVSQ